MSRTERKSTKTTNTWRDHADRGCGGSCWCKVERKENLPIRDRRKLQGGEVS